VVLAACSHPLPDISADSEADAGVEWAPGGSAACLHPLPDTSVDSEAVEQAAA